MIEQEKKARMKGGLLAGESSILRGDGANSRLYGTRQDSILHRRDRRPPKRG